jgi:hypothetical protein
LLEPLAVLAARVACALEKSIQHLMLASDQNLGHLELQALQVVQELLCQSVQRVIQQCKADLETGVMMSGRETRICIRHLPIL